MSNYQPFNISITHSNGSDSVSANFTITAVDCSYKVKPFLIDSIEEFVTNATESNLGANNVFTLELFSESDDVPLACEVFDERSMLNWLKEVLWYTREESAEIEYAFCKYVATQSLSFSKAVEFWNCYYQGAFYDNASFVEEYIRQYDEQDSLAKKCLTELMYIDNIPDLLWHVFMNRFFDVIDCPHNKYYIERDEHKPVSTDSSMFSVSIVKKER